MMRIRKHNQIGIRFPEAKYTIANRQHCPLYRLLDQLFYLKSDIHISVIFAAKSAS